MYAYMHIRTQRMWIKIHTYTLSLLYYGTCVKSNIGIVGVYMSLQVPATHAHHEVCVYDLIVCIEQV